MFPTVDTSPPKIAICPTDLHIAVESDSVQKSVSWIAPTAFDQSGEVTTISTHSPGQYFSVGTTNVIYTFTDGSNNKAICNFTVNIDAGNLFNHKDR